MPFITFLWALVITVLVQWGWIFQGWMGVEADSLEGILMFFFLWALVISVLVQ